MPTKTTTRKSRNRHISFVPDVTANGLRCWMASASQDLLTDKPMGRWTVRAYVTGINSSVFVGLLFKRGPKDWEASDTFIDERSQHHRSDTRHGAVRWLIERWMEEYDGELA